MRHNGESKLAELITLSLMFIVAVGLRLGMAWEALLH